MTSERGQSLLSGSCLGAGCVFTGRAALARKKLKLRWPLEPSQRQHCSLESWGVRLRFDRGNHELPDLLVMGFFFPNSAISTGPVGRSNPHTPWSPCSIFFLAHNIWGNLKVDLPSISNFHFTRNLLRLHTELRHSPLLELLQLGLRDHHWLNTTHIRHHWRFGERLPSKWSTDSWGRGVWDNAGAASHQVISEGAAGGLDEATWLSTVGADGSRTQGSVAGREGIGEQGN